MASSGIPEVWLRGPVAGIIFGLQPVAHALLQAREEVNEIMKGFPETLLWERPGGVASPGFHLQHLAGVINRLFTYAEGGLLSEQQRKYLASEGKPDSNAAELLFAFNHQVEQALEQLGRVTEESLSESRGVGRAQLPTTVLGLLVHAAEHTQRHVGQLLVTVRVLRASA